MTQKTIFTLKLCDWLNISNLSLRILSVLRVQQIQHVFFLGAREGCSPSFRKPYSPPSASFLILFLEREREGEREGKTQKCVVVFHEPRTGDPACNPGMCPDWESNQWPFGLQAGTQPTEPHQPGPSFSFFSVWVVSCFWLISILSVPRTADSGMH